MQKYSINVTSTAVAGLVLAVLSALGVRFPEDTSAFAVVGIASLATVIFFAAFISLKALFSMLLARWLIEIGACSLFGLLTVWIFADQCSFRNLDKHLPEVVWQLSDEGLAAVRQHVLITGASNWGALLDSLLLSVGVCYAAYLMGAMPIAALHIKITRKCALVLACGAVFTLMVVQRLAPYLMSESLGHACSRDAPWLFPTQKRSMPLLAGTAAVRSNVLVTSNQEPSISLNSVSDPDFVLIVIESLRMDAVTREIMPFLYARWKSGVRPSQSLAAANVTHVSLFSLLTTESPFLYYQFRMNQSLWGSRPLTQMRARGYELHAVSSSDLSYRYIAQIGFGGDYQLLTSNAAYFQNQELKVFEKDLAGAKRMKDILSKTRERPVIAFWFIEATHHDYSFPKKGDPSLSELSVFKRSGISKAESEAWKKRYLRAAKFVDGTVKDLVESLEGRDRRTIIGIVGDHGEEFGEAGYFWHGTSLTKYQINTSMVPSTEGIKPASSRASATRAPGNPG